MKKILYILLIYVIAFSLVGCKQKEPATSVEVSNYQKAPDDFTYYKKTNLTPDKHIYVFRNYEKDGVSRLNSVQTYTAQAVQGLFASIGESKLYYDANNASERIWLEDLVATYGVTYEAVNFDKIIDLYQEKFEKKYILYNSASTESINCAMSLCGVYKYLPIDRSLEEYIVSKGFQKAIDTTEMNEYECFKQYKDQFSNDGCIMQHHCLIDIGVASNYFFFWPYDFTETYTMHYRIDFHTWLGQDKPIIGVWPDDEVRDVALLSSYGQFIFCSGSNVNNISLLSCEEFRKDITFKQKKETTGITPEAGKHYICFMMSDGDSLSVEFAHQISSSKMGAERLMSFPMGWSMQPSLYDLAPNILNYYYQTNDENNYFVAAVSGHGYQNPRNNPAAQEFVNALGHYLKMTDMHTVQILDSGPDAKTMKLYSEIDELEGAFYCYGHNYGGGAGSVYWYNDKPFISIRESVCNMSSQSVANRINSYTRDYTKVTGYTAINLHYWSSSYQQACEIVSLLDEDVVVISALDMVRMISTYCNHEDVVIEYGERGD